MPRGADGLHGRLVPYDGVAHAVCGGDSGTLQMLCSASRMDASGMHTMLMELRCQCGTVREGAAEGTSDGGVAICLPLTATDRLRSAEDMAEVGSVALGAPALLLSRRLLASWPCALRGVSTTTRDLLEISRMSRREYQYVTQSLLCTTLRSAPARRGR